jgi:hypothetical protein
VAVAGTAIDDLDVVTATAMTDTARTDIEGGSIVRSDGLTIESYESTNGVVTLYDSNTALGTTTEVFAQTEADVLAIANSLLLNFLNDPAIIAVGDGAFTFGLDADGNGTAESTIVVSSDALAAAAGAEITNIIQLLGVAHGGELGVAAVGDLNLI